MINDVLKKIGLTEYETKVYIALLELGKATSGEILQTANLNTGKIYEILNSLKNKGFISEVLEAGVKRFSPVDPKRIHDYLDEKREEIEEQEKDLDKILPNLLNKINSKKEKTKIEIFYGFKGLKTAYKKEFDYYKKGEIIYVMGVMEEGYYPKEQYAFFINTLYPKRDDAKIRTKKIYSINTKKQNISFEKKSDIKYIDYSSPVNFLVIGELTVIGIHSRETIITITIESREVAKSFIQQFELLWKIAKP